MDSYIGEIRLFSGNYAPKDWALCNGQILQIAQNTALFSILGTYYGGDGKTTFGLPNLQGSAPMHWGNGPGLTPRTIGEKGGSATVTLTTAQLPAHTHAVSGINSAGNQTSPAGGDWATGNARPAPSLYSNAAPNTTLNPAAVSASGGGQAHNNMSQYLAVNYIICLKGYYPARS